MTVIGFDLDMTLIDSRPGIGATLRRVAHESGHDIDATLSVTRLGPPVEWELGQWMPEAEVARWADRYRELYPETAIGVVEVLPGAHEAIAAANALGRSLLITAKHALNAQLHADRLGLGVTQVFGGAWREGKAEVLLAQQATMYVGDHEHDMVAARLAGVIGVGVTTGGTSAAALRDAGADVIISSLLQFEQALAHLP